MPGSDGVIGRVSIKVLPDTDGFRKKAKAQLKKAVEGLELKIELTPDLRSSAVQRQARELKARLERQLGDIDIAVDVDQSRVDRTLSELAAKTAAIGDIDIDVNVDDGKIDEALANVKATIGRITRFPWKLTPAVDLDRGELHSAIERLKQLTGREANIDVPVGFEFNDTKVAASMAALRAKIQAITGQDVSMRPDIKVNFTDAAAKKSLAELRTRLREITGQVHRVKFDVDTRQFSKVTEIMEELDGFQPAWSINEHKIKMSMARLKTQIETITKVDLDVQLDRSRVAQALAEFDTMIHGHGTGSINLEIDPDSESSIRAALAQVQSNLQKHNELKVSVTTDYDSLAKAAEQLKARLDRATATARRIALEVELDNNSVASLKAALAKIEGVRAKQREITFTVATDRRSLDRAAAEIREKLAAIEAEEARIKVELDRDAINKAIRDSTALMERVRKNIGKYQFDLEIDQTKAHAALDQIEAKLIEVEQAKAKVSVELDPVKRRLLELQIERLKRECDDIEANVKPKLDVTATETLRARLIALTRKRVIDISVRTSRKGLAGLRGFTLAMAGLRGFDEVFGGVMRSLGRLDILAPKIATLSSGIAGLGLASISAVGNLLSLGASLASIAPLALALPGLLIGAAAGLTVFILALKDFSKVFPDVADKLSKIQELVSERFWSKAQAPVRGFIDAIFPKLETGFVRVADAAGQFFGNFATSLKNVLSTRIDGWFTSIAKAFSNLAKYTDVFANIIGVLGTLGTSLMPRLATALGNVATRFSKWLTVSEKTGRLKEMVDDAIEAFKDLGRVVGGLYGIFAGLSRAATAAGGSTLNTLADSLQGLSKIINSPKFQKGLTKVFASAYDAMERIRTKAGPGLMHFFSQLGGVIEDIAPKVGDTLGTALGAIAKTLSDPRIRSGIDSLFSGILQAVNLIAPALEKIGPAVGSILKLIGTFVVLIGDSVAQALGYVAPMLKNIADGLEPLTVALNNIIRDVIDAVGPELVNISTTIRDLFEAAADKVTTLWDAMAPFVQAGLKEALKGVNDFLGGIVKAVKDLKPETVEVLGRFIGKLVELAGTAIGQVLSALGKSLGGLGDQANGALGQGSAIDEAGKDGGTLDSLIDKIKGSGDSLNDSANTMQGWGASVAEALDGFAAGIDDFGLVTRMGMLDVLGSIGSGFSTSLTVVQLGMSQIGTFFQTGWTAVSSVTSTIFGSIVGITSGIFGQVLAVTVGALASFVSTIGSWLGRAVLWFAGLPGRITGALAGWATALIASGITAVGGLLNGVISGAVGLFGWFLALPGQIVGLLGDLGRLLLDAGQSIIQGLIDGIQSMFGAVVSVLGGLTSLIPQVKGPPKKDAVLLFGAGQLIIQGLVNGLESQYQSVRDSLSGFSDELSGTELAAPSMAGIAADLNASVNATGAVGATTKNLHYYAAPGSSLGAEEDLFRAAGRARIAWGE